MPFKTEGEVTVWVDPTDDDIASERAKIINKESPLDKKNKIDLPAGLQDQVAQAAATMLPGYGLKLVSESNLRLYRSVASLPLNLDNNKVDIILPIHNAINIAEECIRAVIDRTRWPYHLTIVDDDSDWKTKEILKEIVKEHSDKISLLTNRKNRGFAASVNRGILHTNNRYVCLLNSDVLVTPRWLTKMVMAIEADPKNQIVNPVTNNTALINVEMSEGCSYMTMNRVFEQFAVRRYPEIMPTGFCFMFRRELLSKVGLFDEGYGSYGEETDFWMKTITKIEGSNYPRYRSILADDTYIFHERGTSFSSLGTDEHMGMRQKGSARFKQLWPQWSHWQKTYKVDKAIGPLKSPIPAHVINSSPAPYRVCWVVHSTAFCGGMKYIADIVNHMIEKGVDARVALVLREENSKYETLGELRIKPIVFKSMEDFQLNFTTRVFDRGYVVSSTAEMSSAVADWCKDHPGIKHVLHVQSYEPELTQEEKLKERMKYNFKVTPHVISNSGWISTTLNQELGVSPFATIPPGVDDKLFYPRGRTQGDDRPTFMITLNKTYPFKGYSRGVALCKALTELAIEKGHEIRALAYGVDVIPEAPMVIGMGALPQSRLAKILGTEVDVFLDPSHNHSYGMPALEALVSGCTVVGWDNKGINEYITNGKNGVVLPDDTPIDKMAAVVLDLLVDLKKREKITSMENIQEVLKDHDRRKSVGAFTTAFEDHFMPSLRSPKRKIVFVTPHLRKHGGPTTIIQMANEMAKRGHDVSITTVYSDVNPEVISYTDLPINLDPHNIPKCDVLVTNSDNPMNAAFSTYGKAKKKVMLKLSHNARFKDLEEGSLNLNWDAIVTTTRWLKEVCENPSKDWNYPVKEAHRIGWFHYSHSIMKKILSARRRGTGEENDPIVISTLVHHHPLKGTVEALNVLSKIKEKYGPKVAICGIGEVPKQNFQRPAWMQYAISPNRDQMAELLQQTDIWLGASHTEGLGRMALEAMSASCAVVISDTGAEFAKDNENCLLFPISDTDAMFNAVDKVVSDEKLRHYLAVSGYKTAENRSNPTECIDAFEDVIEGLFK